MATLAIPPHSESLNRLALAGLAVIAFGSFAQGLLSKVNLIRPAEAGPQTVAPATLIAEATPVQPALQVMETPVPPRPRVVAQPTAPPPPVAAEPAPEPLQAGPPISVEPPALASAPALGVDAAAKVVEPHPAPAPPDAPPSEPGT